MEINDKIKNKAKESILAFTLNTMPEFKINWHHRVLCHYLDLFAQKKIKRLIVTMPPRHGKSELVSRRLPAFIFGKNPNTSIIACSYGADLASRMNRDVQRIMEDPTYANLFPESTLNESNVCSSGKGSYLRNSDIFEIVGNRGVYRSAGVGGGITGMGGEFCFIYDTKVLSLSGNTPIQNIKKGDYVWSFNHGKNIPELRRVEAICSRRVPRVVQVETVNGSMVICTPNHPFWSEGEYRAAEDLIPGSGIIGLSKTKEIYSSTKVFSLLKRIHETSIRIREVFKEKSERFLLFIKMFLRAPQFQEFSEMFNVRRNSNNSRKEKRSNVLFEKMQTIDGKIKEKELPGLRENLSTKKLFKFNLFFKLREFTSFKKNEKRWKFELQKWKWVQWLLYTVRQIETFYFRKRFWRLCYLFIYRYISNSSYRWKKDKRFYGKFNNYLSGLSHETPQIRSDSISSIKQISDREITVYDIQVEGNNNFFAEGILVHNCIIDDPIKNQEEADSEVYRQKVWDWYTSTLYTRLEKDGSILVTMTRWHEDDLVGRLLKKNKSDEEFSDDWVVIDFPAIKDTEGNPDDIRNIGEPLWPWKYHKDNLMAIKSTVGGRVWSALYQQRPSPPEGNIFKRNWWKTYRELPNDITKYGLSADLTFKEGKKNDFTVMQVWGKKGADKYLIDQFRAQIGFNGQITALKGLVGKHKFMQHSPKWIEDAANAAALMDTLKHEISGLIAVRPKGSKINRAEAISPQVEAGNIYIPEPDLYPWVHDFIEEHASFPNGAHDDQVDATSLGILKISEGFEDNWQPISFTAPSKWMR